MKSANDPFGKRTCDLLAYSTAPQSTVLLRTPLLQILVSAELFFCCEADLFFAVFTAEAQTFNIQNMLYMSNMSVKLKVVMSLCYKNSILNWNTIPVIENLSANCISVFSFFPVNQEYAVIHYDLSSEYSLIA